MSDRKRVFIVDGYGQIYRSYFAFMSNPLRDREGNNVSAVFGFFNTIMSLVRQYNPEYLVVALDSRGKTFRHELYDQYKANREKTPEDLHAQIPVIKSFLDGMHIPHFERQGMEADDIIATIARKASSEGLDTVMVTGDKDLLQLVRGDVFALRPPRKGEKDYWLCDAEGVLQLFGVRPDQIVDYLTILGDSSDNVPGINGIGEKGAVKLLSEYGTLDKVYENIAALPKGTAAKLEAARDHIALSHELVMLKDDVFDDSEIVFSEFETSAIDWNAGVPLFNGIGSSHLARAAEKLVPAGRFTLTADVDDAASAKAQEDAEDKASLVEQTDEAGLDSYLSGLADGTSVYVKVGTSGDDDMKAKPLSIEISSDGRKGLSAKWSDGVLKTLTENLPRLGIAGYNLKSLMKILGRQGIEKLDLRFDTMLAQWLLETSRTKFDEPDCCEGFAGIADLERRLREKGLYGIFSDMEMPLCRILGGMEMRGIALDTSVLAAFGAELEKSVTTIQNDIYTLCGHEFNLNSPKQLQEVLFVERNLPTGKKTMSGFSTDSDVLENLAMTTEDPVPVLLLKFRMLSKLLGTYVNALPGLINGETGRVHTTFLQTGTATGRLSSKNPNLQNIPIRTDEGRRIRDAFVPGEGCVLMSADYSQIELVVLAHVTGDANLRKAFINGEDVHRETAAMIFGIFPEMVTPDQRRTAKTINFGIMYGMSAFRLAHDIGISRNDAKRFIDRYFEQYSGVSSFIEKTKARAAQDGYVKTLMGHIRYIPEMKSSNKTVLAAAERAAVNTVIQGTAAEIMKNAMISLSGEMEEKGVRSRMLLQVHDEVIFEVPEDEVDLMKDLVRRCMEGACALSVPLRVGIETGRSWGEMH